MKKAILTIITQSHINYALNLFDSISSHSDNYSFAVYVVDSNVTPSLTGNTEVKNVTIFGRDSFAGNASISRAFERYGHSDVDALRWTLKSILIQELLLNNYADKILYFDSDIFVYQSIEFLFDLLDKHSVLLTPHWRDSSPSLNFENFQKNFTDGLYNGGFIGVAKSGLAEMEWWKECCLYRCEKKPDSGLYVDQKYLDFLPVLSSKVYVLDHKGCNVAEWNFNECKRGKKDGEVLICDRYPIVFIHFTKGFNFNILFGQDMLLEPYFKLFSESLKKIDNNTDLYLQTVRDYPFHLSFLENQKKSKNIPFVKKLKFWKEES